MSGNDASPDIERLRWQCRRGMLELDYALTDFLEHHYEDSDAAIQRDFVRLLDCPDQLLHDWLMGHAVPDEPAMRQLMSMIRGSR